MLSVVILSVIMVSVIMLCVDYPASGPSHPGSIYFNVDKIL
jgi:hypothetical protein